MQFFDAARGMNFYDDQRPPRAQLFERFFPGREDVVRLLMEPITYANGSTLEDPAITYGIVFSNFMSKGVYTFAGGTDRLIARDAGRDCSTTASTSASAAMSSGFWSNAAASAGSRSTAATIKTEPWSPTPT